MNKLLLLFIFFSTSVFAEAPQLYNLSQSDVNAISKEISTDFLHTIVAPASTYGQIWGFELGIMGGISKTPNIDRVSKTFDSTAKISAIPTAGIIAGLSAPLGFSGEVNFIPKVTTTDVSLQNTSIAFKWTFTNLIPNSLLDLAVRVHGNSSELSYASIVNNASTGNLPVNTSTAWKNTSTGYNFELSKKLLFIEPYLGFGSVSTKTKIGVIGSTTVQIFTFTTATSYISNNNGNHYYAGLNLNLFFLKLGAEYAKIMDVTKVSAKVSLYF